MPQENNNKNLNLDQDAVRLAKAIKYTESRDKEDAKGASGEFGLYQWMPDTWKATTQKYNLDAGDLSRENQNKAAYMTIKELKDKGYRADQIAAFWNSGKTDGWEEKRGVNKYGVKYDVPAYVGKVKQQYEHLKTSEQPQELVTPSTVGHEQYGVPDGLPQGNGALLKLPVVGKQGIAGVATGITKGAADTAAGMSRTGDAIANQTVGRVVSAIEGNGFHPLPSSRVEDQNIANSQKVKELTTPQGTAEKTGFYGEKVGELVLPGTGGLKSLSTARAIARAGTDALEVVAPKETAKVLQNAMKQGRTETKGLFRSVEMTPDDRTIRSAKAIEDLVKTGKVSVKNTASQNANAVYESIGSEADTLVKQLKSMDVTPILQQGELEALFAKASREIGENPTMVGNAGETSARIFTKFKSFLPQKGDIDAGDLLAARKKLDAWVRSQKGDKVFDPGTENAMSTALRAIRQEANDLIAAKAPDVAVKESLAKQSAMYDALENIASKGFKEVGTTGPGRFLQRHPYVKTGLTGLLPAGLVGSYVGAKVFGD